MVVWWTAARTTHTPTRRPKNKEIKAACAALAGGCRGIQPERLAMSCFMGHAAVAAIVAFALPALCSDWQSEELSMPMHAFTHQDGAHAEVGIPTVSSSGLLLAGEPDFVDSGPDDDNDDEIEVYLEVVARTGPGGYALCGCSPYLINNGVCDDVCFNEACRWDGSDCNRTGCRLGRNGCSAGTAELCEAACPSAAHRISAGECDADCDAQPIPAACYAHADKCDERTLQRVRVRLVCVISVLATGAYVAALVQLIQKYRTSKRGEKPMAPL